MNESNGVDACANACANASNSWHNPSPCSSFDLKEDQTDVTLDSGSSYEKLQADKVRLEKELVRSREATAAMFTANQEAARVRVRLERELREAREDAEASRRALLSAAAELVRPHACQDVVSETRSQNISSSVSKAASSAVSSLFNKPVEQDNDQSRNQSVRMVTAAVSEVWARRVSELETELCQARQETERRAKAAAETMVLLDEELRLGTKRLGKLVLRFFETLPNAPTPGKDSGAALRALSEEAGWQVEDLCAAGFRCKLGCNACTTSSKEWANSSLSTSQNSENEDDSNKNPSERVVLAGPKDDVPGPEGLSYIVNRQSDYRENQTTGTQAEAVASQTSPLSSTISQASSLSQLISDSIIV